MFNHKAMTDSNWEQMTAFTGNLELWKRKMGENETASFPTSEVAPGRRKCWVLDTKNVTV